MMTEAQKIEAWKKLAADIADTLANLEVYYAKLTPPGSPEEVARERKRLLAVQETVQQRLAS